MKTYFKAPASMDPRQVELWEVPLPAQIAGVQILNGVVSRTIAANGNISKFGPPFNPSAAAFPYYVDAALIGGINVLRKAMSNQTLGKP